MNIVFIDMDDIKNPYWAGGQARTTRELAKRFVVMGHSVTVFTSKYPGWQDYQEEGIIYRHIGLASANPKVSNLGFLAVIPLLLARLDADVIIESFTAPFSTSFAPLFTRVPVVGFATFFNAGLLSGKYHLPFALIERWGFKCYQYAMALNEKDQEKMVKMNSRIISQVMHEGVDNAFLTIKRKKAAHILFIGRFDMYQKGIDVMLGAYAKIMEHVTYPLVIGGHGADEQKIHSMINKLGLQDKVRVVGPAYGQLKEYLLSQAVCTLLPSRYETFSLFTLESLAAGVPVVAFDIPGLSWSDPHVVMKAKPYDATDYAQIIMKTLDPSYNKRLSAKSKKYAKQFTWDEMAQKMALFLSQCAKPNVSTSTIL